MLMQATDWTSLHLGYIDFGVFVLPNWYILAVGIAALAYYAAFRKHDQVR
jgi:hypothetical protein